MDHNSTCLQADIKKYQKKLKCEGYLFLIIYIIPAIAFFCIVGLTVLEWFSVIFFVYPLLGYLALEALQQNSLICLNRYRKVLKITFWTAGILGSISSPAAIYFLINVINFEETQKRHIDCAICVSMQSLMLFICGVIAVISIITFTIAYISYKHSGILIELLSKMQLDNPDYRGDNSQQYIPMQSLP